LPFRYMPCMYIKIENKMLRLLHFLMWFLLSAHAI